MKVNSASLVNLDSGAVCVLMTQEAARRRPLRTAGGGAVFDAALRRGLEGKRFSGEREEKLALWVDRIPVLLVVVGKGGELSSVALRALVRRAAADDHLAAAARVQVVPHDRTEKTCRAVAEGLWIGGYGWNRYLSSKPSARRVRVADKQFVLAGADAALLRETAAVCEGVTLTRDLVNENADIVNAPYFEERLRGLLRGRPGVKLRVLEKKDLQKLGMNLYLAVNKGSQYPPKLMIVQYDGGRSGAPYTALVGKGMTFDSGGLNIKPTGSIEDMRLDMAGAGALLGVLRNVLHFKPRCNLLLAFCMAENAVDALSYKPGDVYVGFSGKSVEITSTDAEGRLVLADANAYITKHYRVGRLVNIATLTGAVLVALAQDHSGLMSNDDGLARRLEESAEATDDRVWRLPIYEELGGYIKSKCADLRNTCAHKGMGGTITAGEFLRQFVAEGVKWAHLDIAGTAFINNSEHGYFGYGATGAGVRLLTHFVRHLD